MGCRTLQGKRAEILQQRINKAIEYIKENACYDKDIKKCCDDLNYNECDELLEILEGKNERK